MVVADLDLGAHHQAQAHDGHGRPLRRPELLSLTLDPRPARPARVRTRPAPPPMRPGPPMERAMNLPTEHLINELQTLGVRLADPRAGRREPPRRRGPSDHKALTSAARRSWCRSTPRPPSQPLRRRSARRERHEPHLARRGRRWPRSRFPLRPRFYELATADGVPYSKIAALHGATCWRRRCCRPASATEPHQGLPVLRHRPVARRRPDRRAQDAGAARRGREGRRGARRRQAHGDDHRHAASADRGARDPVPRAPPRSKRRSTCRSRPSASRPTTTPGSTA